MVRQTRQEWQTGRRGNGQMETKSRRSQRHPEVRQSYWEAGLDTQSRGKENRRKGAEEEDSIKCGGSADQPISRRSTLGKSLSMTTANLRSKMGIFQRPRQLQPQYETGEATSKTGWPSPRTNLVLRIPQISTGSLGGKIRGVPSWVGG